MKQCSKCGENKPETEFYNHKQKKDGLYSHCKECHKSKAKEWRQANPDKVAAGSQRWRDRYPEGQRIASK
jgi:NAD-dependent SIR2 family protein deacetylase